MTFSLIGVGPQLPKPGVFKSPGALPPNGRSRYIDPRRSRQAEVARQRAGSATPRRITSKSQAPLRPIVVLARGRDSKLFRFVLEKSGITPQMNLAEAVEAIRRDGVVGGLLAQDARLHRCIYTHVTVRLTLKTKDGYSRFEGTVAQLLETFQPAARAANA